MNQGRRGSSRSRCARLGGTTGWLLGLSVAVMFNITAPVQAEDATEVVIRVPGRSAWVDTGISVSTGDRITISGSGEVCFNEHDDSCFPPQGYPRDAFVKDYFELDYAYCEDEFDSFDHAALILRIGDTALQVGRRITLTGVSGPVRLGINDCSLEGDYGNSGWYRAVITLERGAR